MISIIIDPDELLHLVSLPPESYSFSHPARFYAWLTQGWCVWPIKPDVAIHDHGEYRYYRVGEHIAKINRGTRKSTEPNTEAERISINKWKQSL